MEKLLRSIELVASTLDPECRLAVIEILTNWWDWQDTHLFDDVSSYRRRIVQAVARPLTPAAPGQPSAPLLESPRQTA